MILYVCQCLPVTPVFLPLLSRTALLFLFLDFLKSVLAAQGEESWRQRHSSSSGDGDGDGEVLDAKKKKKEKWHPTSSSLLALEEENRGKDSDAWRVSKSPLVFCFITVCKTECISGNVSTGPTLTMHWSWMLRPSKHHSLLWKCHHQLEFGNGVHILRVSACRFFHDVQSRQCVLDFLQTCNYCG